MVYYQKIFRSSKYKLRIAFMINTRNDSVYLHILAQTERHYEIKILFPSKNIFLCVNIWEMLFAKDFLNKDSNSLVKYFSIYVREKFIWQNFCCCWMVVSKCSISTYFFITINFSFLFIRCLGNRMYYQENTDTGLLLW